MMALLPTRLTLMEAPAVLAFWFQESSSRRRHDVIARFGRFPDRNALLGRVSRVEELAFLQTPEPGF